MKKFRSLILSLLVFAVGVAPAWAEPGEGEAASGETLAASALADEGWGLLNAPGTTPPFYAEAVCDAPELARDRFRRAAELDPGNASAWHGWGRAEQELGSCPTGHGRLLTWAQMEGLAYIDFQDLFSLPWGRLTGAFTGVAEATAKFRRAAELAPDDPAILADLGRNLMFRLWGEKDLDTRLALADEALAAFEKSRELGAAPPDHWSQWDLEFLVTIANEPEPVVWQRLLAGLLRLYDREAEAAASSGRPLKSPDQAGVWNRTVVSLLEAAQAPPERLGRDKALAILSAAHIRAVRLTAPPPEQPVAPTDEAGRTSGGHVVAVGETPAVPEDSSVLIVKKSRQVNTGEVARMRRWGLLGRVELRQAAFEAGFPQWQAQVESAGRHYWTMINGLKAIYFPEGRAAGAAAEQGGHYQAIDEWLEAAAREPRDDRRLILALGALDILEDAQKLLDNDPDQAAGEDYRGAPGRQYKAMMQIAAIMPEGENREALLAKANSGFSQLAAASEPVPGGFYGSVHYLWAEGLIELAYRENDLRRFKGLVDQAGGLVRQSLEQAADPECPRDHARWPVRLAMTYNTWLMNEKNPEHRRYFLESALNFFDEAVRTQSILTSAGPAAAIYNSIMGDICFQLSELSAPEAGRRMWLSRAALHYQRADEIARLDPDSARTTNDHSFRLGQIYANAYTARTSGAFDNHSLLSAVQAWRAYFDSLPAQAENTFYPRLRTEDRPGQAPETFRNQVTANIAMRMMYINTVLDTDRLDPWALTVMAGLYRELAVSAVLTAEYQSLYLGRAEKLLRQAIERGVEAAARSDEARETDSGALAIPNADYELGTASRDVSRQLPTDRIFRQAAEGDLARAKAELGLVLSEWTLLGGPCGDGGRECLREAEKLWREADELNSGASRYARARWAAWLGDAESVKTLISHTRDEVGLGLFPTLAEARRDPAFDEVKNQPWFKKQWYGFVR